MASCDYPLIPPGYFSAVVTSSSDGSVFYSNYAVVDQYLAEVAKFKKQKKYQCTKCLETSNRKLCKICNTRSCFDLGYEWVKIDGK